MLSLDEVRVFLGETGNLTSYDATAKTLGGQDAVFDLDAAGDVSVKLNYRLNSGSGSGDMYLLVPNSAFDGQGPEQLRLPVLEVRRAESEARPTAGSRSGPSGPRRRFRRHRSAPRACRAAFSSMRNGTASTVTDVGIAGVTIQLRMMNADGLIPSWESTTTDANGFYQFTGLSAGKYEIVEWTNPPVA